MITTITILRSLQESALTKSDPKPSLRCLDPHTHGGVPAVVCRAIDEHYSQAIALEKSGLVGLTPEHIQTIKNAEVCDQLWAGYAAVLADLESAHASAPRVEENKPEQKARLSKKDVVEFLQKIILAQEIDMPISTALKTIEETATSKTLKTVIPALHEAIVKDGKNIAQAMRESKAFDTLSARCVEFGEKTGMMGQALRPYVAALKEDLAEIKEAARVRITEGCTTHKTKLKVAVGVLAGIVVGAILTKKR